jgi:hypothetical protein
MCLFFKFFSDTSLGSLEKNGLSDTQGARVSVPNVEALVWRYNLKGGMLVLSSIFSTVRCLLFKESSP